MSLEGSKTEQNLKDAFAGESQANRRYLYFEDRLTVQYQIQEMLRTERIFEIGGIEEELGGYNPLIPDGENLKATLMLEYEDREERQIALGQLVGIEDTVWLQVDGYPKAKTIADEDLERSREEKSSAVHFLRFELGAAATAFRTGARLSAGVSHPNYSYELALRSRMQSANRWRATFASRQSMS